MLFSIAYLYLTNYFYNSTNIQKRCAYTLAWPSLLICRYNHPKILSNTSIPIFMRLITCASMRWVRCTSSTSWWDNLTLVLAVSPKDYLLHRGKYRMGDFGAAYLAKVNQNVIMSWGLYQYLSEKAAIIRIWEATLVNHRKQNSIEDKKGISPKSFSVCHECVLTIALTVMARPSCTALSAVYRG